LKSGHLIYWVLAAFSSSVFASDTSSLSSFDEDVSFLRAHTKIIVLRDEKGVAEVALAPAWQGRVMTSTVDHHSGRGFGWINRELIASGEKAAHMNPFGGEDRLWLGPEGGQFSIYFAPGVPFDYAHWFVPDALDTKPFKTLHKSRDRASFEADFALLNYSGTQFHVKLKREVHLLDNKTAWADLGLASTGHVALVAYESKNTLINAGQQPWEKETGLLSIWMLGMFAPSSGATIIVPVKSGAESELGVRVTSDYFGIIPPERLKATENAIFLRGDGKFRSKIGISPRRAVGKLGSYDSDHQVLTIVQFNQPEGVDDYVNSLWKLQQNPYGGDAANAYNDGPPAPNVKPLGPFFEMESSSPAAMLPPSGSIEHTRRTIHLTGPETELDSVAHTALGVSLAEIRSAFPGK
jgi:hypothetical protein